MSFEVYFATKESERRAAELARDVELRRRIAERVGDQVGSAQAEQRAPLRIRLHNPFGASDGHRLLTLH